MKDSAAKALANELSALTRNPVEGFDVAVIDEGNLFEWSVGIYGPPATLYQGGYFRAKLSFPQDYPYSPPKMKFLDEMWHPNIYKTGELCISILHPPGEDAMSGERPEERWNPTQTVRTILISVVSLLNEPNITSPANVDASVMYRDRRSEYVAIVNAQVDKSRARAEAEGIYVPTTVEDYTKRSRKKEEDYLMDDEDLYDDYDDSYDDHYDEDEDEDVELYDEDGDCE
eukprot:Colp12_sorted_trinity150504_noHs@20727